MDDLSLALIVIGACVVVGYVIAPYVISHRHPFEPKKKKIQD